MDEAIWSQPPFHSRTLGGHLTAEVVVIGAGISGLMSAYLLAGKGYDVHIIDGAAPGSGMTARSTAHISTAVDEGWRNLVEVLGLSHAQHAARAYIAAVDLIESIAVEEAIGCDFARIDGYVVGERANIGTLAAEKAAALQAGLPGIDWSGAPYPRNADGIAVRFPRQARLHPLKFVRGLADCIVRRGGYFHRATAQSVAEYGHGNEVITATGYVITATRAVIVATNSPLYVPDMTPPAETYLSYVLAGAVPKGQVEDAVAWDLDDPYHYTRIQPGRDPDHDILIAGGADHKVTEPKPEAAQFALLEKWVRTHFPNIGAIEKRWTGTVKQTRDNLGLMGRSAQDSNVFIFEGDGGLGFSHAAIGALIVRDFLEGRAHSWCPLFDPLRFGPMRHPLILPERAITRRVSDEM